MKMDVSKFKKISSDDKQTVLKHPRGHEIVIAHHALTPQLRKQIKSIPSKDEEKVQKFSRGGEAQDKEGDSSFQDKLDKMVNGLNQDAATVSAEAAPAVNAVNQAQNDAAALAMAENNPPAAPPAPADSSGAFLAGQGPVNNAPAPASLPQSMDSNAAYAGSLQKGLAGMSAGAEAEAKAQGELGKQQAAILEQQNAALQKIQSEGQQRFDHYMQQADAVAKDVMNGHINANHYMESMSTGKRVATAIGLILGGMGAGLTGGENPAQKFLEQQISRDVDAQKANLGKQETLYSHFIRQGETAQNATKLAQAFTANIYANQALAATAKMQDPILRAQKEQQINEWRLKYAPQLQQAAMQGAALKAAQGSMSGGDPSALVRYLVPEPHQKAVFDEIERAQDTRHMGNSILAAFDQAAKDNTVLKTGGGMLRTPASVLALHQAMQPTFKDLEGTVRQAAMDNTFTNITPKPGDLESTIKTKRAALVDYLKSKTAAPTAKGFGIDLDKFQTTRPPSGAPNLEGQTATNAQGQRIIMKGGRWVPYGG